MSAKHYFGFTGFPNSDREFVEKVVGRPLGPYLLACLKKIRSEGELVLGDARSIVEHAVSESSDSYAKRNPITEFYETLIALNHDIPNVKPKLRYDSLIWVDARSKRVCEQDDKWAMQNREETLAGIRSAKEEVSA